MEATATAFIAVSVAIWIGAIVFQSAIVAPVVFAKLDKDQAKTFLRQLFPRLFSLGLGCGLVMIASSVYLGLSRGWTDAVGAITALTCVMLAAGALSLWMVPYINTARDAGRAGSTTFKRLHRINVSLTVGVLLLGIAVLYVIAHSASTVV